jgi:hypothetical protein
MKQFLERKHVIQSTYTFCIMVDEKAHGSIPSCIFI